MPCCYRTLTAPKTPVPLPPAADTGLPARLRRARLALRLSKRAMADRLGVPEASYLLWERGRKSPSLRALPPLLAALGQPPTAPAADAPLGTRLRAWRLADGLSQAEAACRAGLDPKTLGTAELGRPVSRASAAALETMRRRAGAADRA